MKTKIPGWLCGWVWLAMASVALAQPTNVSIAPAGGQVLVYWPTSLTNGVLQTTTDLAGTNWVTASNAVPVTAVVVPNAAPGQFFRYFQTAPIKSTTADGLALVPAGAFTMGDTLDGEGDAVPVTNVIVSAFYMDTNLVSLGQWQAVYNWAATNGYVFDDPGDGKAANQPVNNVDWFDGVLWSNARSQQAGLAPVYFTDAAFTQVYTNVANSVVYVNWAAGGYRLPTEAEWEKAARAGSSGQRFPRGNTISESQANYFGNTSYNFDSGPNGNNPSFTGGGTPYTSPVGTFAPNGYGLFDMAGNVFEWCWDLYGATYAGGTDPRGPVSGPGRVLRGGAWNKDAASAGCANRFASSPGNDEYNFGFRCVRGL